MKIETIENQEILTIGKRLKEHKSLLEIDGNSFTLREKEIIVELANGLTSDQIGDKLFISKHTVDTHRKNIYRKGKFKCLRDVILFSFFL